MIQRYIPGWSRVQKGLLLATAFGVVIHELAHKEMVEDFGFQVQDVCFFQLGDPSGYVIHDEPRKYVPTFAISVAPFILNTSVAYTGFVIGGGVLTANSISSLSYAELGFAGVLLWLGVSAGVHAFPSTQDTKNIWQATKRRWWNPLAILGIPFVALLLVLNKLRPFGSNYIYTGLIGASSYYSLTFLPVSAFF